MRATKKTMFTLAFFHRYSNILKFAHSWLSMLITIHWPTYRDFILGRGFWSKEDRWNKLFLALTLQKLEVIRPSFKETGTSRVATLSSLVTSWPVTLQADICVKVQVMFNLEITASYAVP